MTQKESHVGSSKHCHKMDPSSRQCASPCSVLCITVCDIKGIMVMPQPRYSPDLAPCDFFLFQNIESVVKEHHFEATETSRDL
jgi:hypothetical protein